MFEKEVEFYASEKYSPKTDSFIVAVAEDAFKDGAELGYNKANEWHYNGIPHDDKPYLCKVEQPTKYDVSEYEILFF